MLYVRIGEIIVSTILQRKDLYVDDDYDNYDDDYDNYDRFTLQSTVHHVYVKRKTRICTR